jgi:hypothetical protein
MLVMKVDPDGNLVWARQIWTERGDRAVGLAIGADQHPTVLGYRGHLAKIDSGGELVWSRQIQEHPTLQVTFVGIAQSGEGAVLGGRTVRGAGRDPGYRG